MARITLSGRNNVRETRTVYLDEVRLGEVIPVTNEGYGPAWEARDVAGHLHGTWLTDWYAADALQRGTQRSAADREREPLSGLSRQRESWREKGYDQ